MQSLDAHLLRRSLRLARQLNRRCFARLGDDLELMPRKPFRNTKRFQNGFLGRETRGEVLLGIRFRMAVTPFVVGKETLLEPPLPRERLGHSPDRREIDTHAQDHAAAPCERDSAWRISATARSMPTSTARA